MAQLAPSRSFVVCSAIAAMAAVSLAASPANAQSAEPSASPAPVATESSAPPDAERVLADEHVRTGVADFNARLFRQAAVEFETAYEISHDPLLLSNIGSARYEAGDLRGARDALTEYLQRVVDPPNREAVQERLDRVNEQLAAQAAIASSAPPTAIEMPATPVRVESRVAGPARIAGFVVGGVGIVTLGAGIGLYAGVDASYQACRRTVGGCDAASEPRTLDATSVALMWSGAAVAVGGALLAILAPSRVEVRFVSRTPRVTAMAIDPRGGVMLGGTF